LKSVKTFIRNIYSRKIWKVLTIITIFLSLTLFQLNSLPSLSAKNTATINISNVFSLTSTNFLLGKIYALREDYILDGTAITADDNGNSYFTGFLETDIFSTNSYAIIGKMNSTGDILWIKYWSKQDYHETKDIIFDSNKIYLIGSLVNNTNSDYSDIFLVCFDSETGLEIWNTTFGLPLWSEKGNSITIYNDLIIFSGFSAQYYSNIFSPSILFGCLNKTTGNLIWSNTMTNSFYDTNPKLAFDYITDSFYLSYNRLNTDGDKCQYKYYLLKYDINGTLIWSRDELSDNCELISDIYFDQSKNIVKLLGKTIIDKEQNLYDIFLVSYSTSGILLKKTIFEIDNKNEDPSSFVKLSNNKYLIAGTADSDAQKDRSAFLALVDENESLLWLNKVEYFTSSSINDIARISNDNIVIIGNCKFSFDFVFERILIGFTKDSDEDMLSDYWEPIFGTDPEKFDTDSDGYSDGIEYLLFTDPLNPRSNPHTRNIWERFAIALFIVLILVFLIVNGFLAIMKLSNDEQNSKSFIVRLFDTLIKKIRHRKIE